MRKAFAVLLLLSASVALAAAPKAVPLKVEGDGIVQVVKSFPVTVTAPGGKGSFTIFTFPDSVKASKAKNVLTITAAPKGVHKIRAITLTYSKATEEFVEDTGEVDLAVGDVPQPGPGPTPPGPEPTPLVKALKAAYDSEADPTKAALIKALAAVYETGAALVADGKARTFGALDKAMEAGAVAGGVSKKLPAVQGAIVLYLKDKGLPFSKGSAVVIDDSNRDKTRGALAEVSLALKEAVQ